MSTRKTAIEAKTRIRAIAIQFSKFCDAQCKTFLDCDFYLASESEDDVCDVQSSRDCDAITSVQPIANANQPTAANNVDTMDTPNASIDPRSYFALTDFVCNGEKISMTDERAFSPARPPVSEEHQSKSNVRENSSRDLYRLGNEQHSVSFTKVMHLGHDDAQLPMCSIAQQSEKVKWK